MKRVVKITASTGNPPVDQLKKIWKEYGTIDIGDISYIGDNWNILTSQMKSSINNAVQEVFDAEKFEDDRSIEDAVLNLNAVVSSVAYMLDKR